MHAPVLLAETQREGEARLAALPPERRLAMVAATPERAAEVIAEYVDAGFGGFTFSNAMLPPDQLDLAAEVIRLVGDA
jgi:alkanesulfonate monooxygenase SsuD/methylene tetrahydromethanopterin reductase-like flavin-dependent oxidoreductase (luciferase family)